MKTKLNKESRNLLIALLLGDGTICSNYSFKLSHCYQQEDLLLWKIALLNKNGIRNNGLKTYIKNQGYNTGVPVVYTQINIVPFIKVLKRVMYKPKKIIGNRKILNRLDAQGVAIWYMDDGHINIRKTGGTIHGFYIKISTCEPIEQVQVIIDYFKEVWDVSFYPFSEGKKTYSLCCGTKEGLKFIKIVEPFVIQVPSMHHKIQYDLSQRTRVIYGKESFGRAVKLETQESV